MANRFGSRWGFGLLVMALLAGCGEPPVEEEAAPDAAPPATDLWLAPLETDEEGLPRVGTPENLTQRPLYDNQPHFLPDGRAFVYTAGREDGGTDIHHFDLDTRTSRPLLESTPESEYSPTPLADGRIVVVRVEADGTTQRLWALDPDGEGEPELLISHLEPVGYHAWLDSDRVVTYVLGDPASLQIAEVGTDFHRVIAEGVGPAVRAIPGEGAVSFVEIRNGESRIRRFDGNTGSTATLVRGPAQGADHAWTPDGVLMVAEGRNLFAFRPGVDDDWIPLGGVGPEDIVWSRMAVSPDGDRIVLVGTR